MTIKYLCTKRGNAGEIVAQVNAQSGVMTLPDCPHCDKHLFYGADVPSQGITYETSFGVAEARESE